MHVYDETAVDLSAIDVGEVEVGVNAGYAAEEVGHLVDEVGSQITQQAVRRPCFEGRGVVEVDPRETPPHIAELAGLDDAQQRLDIGIPAAVVEDGQKQA